MLTRHHRSLNLLWATLLLEQLNRQGIRHVCLAPGSRSTPLVMAADRLAQQPGRLQIHHHFDERGLGFLALGIAKACQQPVAIITTSGTAVANLYSAVIEAAQTHIPLIIVSADRPPHLHDCGANQAINQHGIFADYPRQSLYLPPPSLDYPAEQLLQQISLAVDTATAEQQPGVCQINCMFDEPLYPNTETIDYSRYLTPISGWLDSDTPYRCNQHPATAITAVDAGQWRRFTQADGVIVVGSLPDANTASAIKALAQRLGWPLLVDIQSQLKTDPDCLGLVDQLLCDPHAQNQLQRARQLLQFGSRLVSKRLQQFVDDQPWQQFWLVHPGNKPLAPGHNSTTFFGSTIVDWCLQASSIPVEEQTPTHPSNRINRELQQRQSVLAAELAARFALEPNPAAPVALTELSTAYQLLNQAPNDSWLLAGNSLSIRLLDLIGGNMANGDHGLPQIVANRGASGIDGLVSTALGLGIGSGQPGTLLLGDYSLLYDLNALALLTDHPHPLVIIVLNNDGGGIFRMLPVADEALRQRHYQRPHGLSFERACQMFRLDYHQPQTLSQFVSNYLQGLTRNAPCLIEVTADARTTEQQIKALTAKPD